MATLYPELTEGELGTLHSRGEATVYRACRDGLPDDYDVYFSVGWILQRPDRHAHDGETDFVICHREHGFLTVEVKGGGIGFDATTGAWSSTDRSGNVHRIKDPARHTHGQVFHSGKAPGTSPLGDVRCGSGPLWARGILSGSEQRRTVAEARSSDDPHRFPE